MSAVVSLVYALLVLSGAAQVCSRISSLRGFEALIGGLAGLTILGASFHFFLPLKFVAPYLGLLLVGLSWFWFRSQSLTLRAALVYLFTVTTLTAIASNSELLYDTGLYHLPHLRILLESPLQMGIGLIHDRFANATLHPTLLGMFYPLWGDVGPAFLLAAALSVLLIGCLTTDLMKSRTPHTVLGLSLSLALFGGILFEAVGSPATDLPAGILSLFSVFFFYKSIETEGQSGVWGCWLSSGLAVCIKLSQAPLLLVPLALFLFLRLKWYRVLKRPVFWLVPLMIFLMSVSSFLRSGCWAYPASVTCVPKTPFSLPAEAAFESTRWVKTWARDSTAQRPEEVLGNYSWVGNWITRLQRANGVFAYLWGALFLSLPLLFYLNRQTRSPDFYLLQALMVCLIFWWTQAPELRFAAGILIAIPAVAISGWLAQAPWLRSWRVPFVICALMGHLIYLGAQSKVFDFGVLTKTAIGPFPMLPTKAGQSFQIQSGERFWAPLTGNQCWDLPAPCMHDVRPHLRRDQVGPWYIWSHGTSVTDR